MGGKIDRKYVACIICNDLLSGIKVAANLKGINIHVTESNVDGFSIVFTTKKKDVIKLYNATHTKK